MVGCFRPSLPLTLICASATDVKRCKERHCLRYVCLHSGLLTRLLVLPVADNHTVRCRLMNTARESGTPNALAR